MSVRCNLLISDAWLHRHKTLTWSKDLGTVRQDLWPANCCFLIAQSSDNTNRVITHISSLEFRRTQVCLAACYCSRQDVLRKINYLYFSITEADCDQKPRLHYSYDHFLFNSHNPRDEFNFFNWFNIETAPAITMMRCSEPQIKTKTLIWWCESLSWWVLLYCHHSLSVWRIVMLQDAKLCFRLQLHLFFLYLYLRHYAK